MGKTLGDTNELERQPERIKTPNIIYTILNPADGTDTNYAVIIGYAEKYETDADGVITSKVKTEKLTLYLLLRENRRVATSEGYEGIATSAYDISGRHRRRRDERGKIIDSPDNGIIPLTLAEEFITHDRQILVRPNNSNTEAEFISIDQYGFTTPYYIGETITNS